jgi:hypothetical protein
MANLRLIIATLKATDFEQESLKAIRVQGSEVLDMNTGQLMDGKTAADQPVLPPYAPMTIFKKIAKGQSLRVTLFDEGDFQEAFYMEAGSYPVKIRSKDWKEGKLVEKYGQDIFGLTQDNLESVRKDIVLPSLIDYIRKAVLV